MVLLCAGAAASLAGVWTLAGLSERSGVHATPRALAAAGVGLLGVAAVYHRAPSALRGDLLLPALFGAVSGLALAAGAAKLDAALADRDGPRAVRRAAGLVAGTFLSMAAVGAASLELVLSSLSHARFGWAYMLPTVVALLVVFAQRARLAGAGALALGRRGLVLGLSGLVLLAWGRWTVSPTPVTASRSKPSISSTPVAPIAPRPSEAAVHDGPEVEVPALSAAPSASATASSEPAPSASVAAAPAGAPGELQIATLVSRGMLEADARGGVDRRKDRLQACLTDPKHQQSGALTLKIGIDASGSVAHVRPTGGDLVGTPLAACLLPMFYKMGFAAPASSGASFEITLRSHP
ncbi:MAG TPA: hypothetical protein VJN18_28530 [Polyangiaceae bacterium]|nr:hypothetical protein [Polyangiaceae bacterium]